MLLTLNRKVNRSLWTWIALVGCIPLLAGCSDFKFLDKHEIPQGNDPREDIRLSKVEADLTSSGLVLHRVNGKDARYSQTRGRLTIQDVSVNTFERDGTTQGMTRARQAEVFITADSAAGRARNDMRFDGSVRYRAPNRDRPETDSLQLNTEHLLYNAAEGEFQGESSHTVVMMPPGKRPFYMRGSQLRVPRDMRKFSMIGGAVGPNPDADYNTSYTQLTRELDQIGTKVTSDSASPPVRGTPIQTPPLEPAPTLPAPPTVPPMQPAPTLPAPPIVPPMQPAPTPTPRNGVVRIE